MSDATETTATKKPLWHREVKLPIIGVTGEPESGKTLFGLTINPEKTICYDFELSASPYVDALGFEHIDMGELMLSKFPDGYTPAQMFEAWLDHLKALPSGKYTVVLVDTIGDIETGLADYVADHYADFSSFSSADKFRATKGIFWGVVKSFWKRILVDVASRCETFVFTSHQKYVYSGDRKTNQRTHEGKDVLMKLASLFLHLDRNVVKSGKISRSKLPRATVEKGRIVRMIDGVLTPCTGAAIADCTPDKIRELCEKPADLNSAKSKAEVQSLSEDVKLELQAEIAANEATAETARTKRAELTAAAYKPGATNGKPVSRHPVDEPAGDRPAETKPEAKPAPDKPEPSKPQTFTTENSDQVSSTSDQHTELRKLSVEMKLTPEKWKAILAKGYHVDSGKKLDFGQAEELIDWMKAKIRQREGASDVTKWAANQV